ncbi:phosphotransferase enzyme family protein [Streptomyces sp. NPDC012888]|uniref:phosphotransferase enzyme family protein n=1 Tax=Streptomyces sp. NPDC012888 TaxID=3364855 RepID=UPI00369E7409
MNPAVALLLAEAYGLDARSAEPAPAGTETVNHVVTGADGGRWFVKCYPPHADLGAEERALELGRFAARAGVPVPLVRAGPDGRPVVRGPGAAVSVSSYVGDAETAEGGLHGGRWAAVGTALARLHTALARHPVGGPRAAPRAEVFEAGRSARRLRGLIGRYGERPREGFEGWALAVARERLGLLPRVAALAGALPARLTVQVVHGDLAAPNLLLRGAEVAALVDFRPPRPRAAVWEIARIGCDPRTVVTREDWPDGLARLIAAYREGRPGLPAEELAAVPRVALCALAESVHPLDVPLDRPGAVTRSLRTYALHRDRALGILLERLPEAELAVRKAII